MKHYLLSLFLLCSAVHYIQGESLQVTIAGVSPYTVDSLYALYDESPYILTNHIVQHRSYYQQMMHHYLDTLSQDLKRIDVILIKKSGKAAALLAGSAGLFFAGRELFVKGRFIVSDENPPKATPFYAVSLFLASMGTTLSSIPVGIYGIRGIKDAIMHKRWLEQRYEKGQRIIELLASIEE